VSLDKTPAPAATQIRLKVPQQVARIVKEASVEEQLQAARGEVPLAARDLLTTLFFLVHGGHPQIRAAALGTVKRLNVANLQPLLADPDLHPRLLDFLARTRMSDSEMLVTLIGHPGMPIETLRHLVSQAPPAILELLGRNEGLLVQHPELRTLLANNSQQQIAAEAPLVEAPARANDNLSSPQTDDAADEDTAQEEESAEEEVNLSKYQQSLDMGVSAKIKMALTGDKEWRAIFLKDANKLVSSAVMKNPRITEGEVLMVAKSKTSSEELIRLIMLNPDWIKNAQIQKALVVQPRTPLPKALRYMSVLTEKDLKILAKSRGVSQVIVNTARRMLLAKLQKK
jgi:hypothetical protein